MNPADVMDLPIGLIAEMNEVLRDEHRARRREAAKSKARGGRGRRR